MQRFAEGEMPCAGSYDEKQLLAIDFRCSLLASASAQLEKRLRVQGTMKGNRSKRSAPRRRPETERFRVLLGQLRRDMGWTQDDLGARLGVTRRTLSSWETGYWLPPEKQRVHILLALNDAPPEYLLAMAKALGVPAQRGTAPVLAEIERAIHEPEPKPRPTPAALRSAVDDVVHKTADALDVRANDLRAALARVLDACDALGADLAGTREAVAPTRAAKK